MILAKCPICQEFLGSDVNDHISALFCGHAYHATCIKKWLETSSTCPQCRILVFGSDLIPRLYFSFIDDFSELNGNVQQTGCLQPSNIQDVSSTHLEIVRLRGELSSLEARMKLAERKINEQATEINTISELYRETSELYRLEQQKCLQARTQLSGYSKVVKEAQEMQDECLQLRQKATELKDIETLVRSNENAAMELMQKYRNQNGNYSPETICNLFRWVAILRGELSETQNRSRKYRADAHRLRRSHAASTRLVTDLEQQLEHYKNRVTQMESEMMHLLSQSARSPPAAESPPLPTSSTPTSELIATPGAGNNLGFKQCLHFIEMFTPEINPRTPKGLVGSVLPEITQVTPRVNPFKCESTPKVDDHVDASKGDAPSPREFSRRPSSLFRLAIMRNFNNRTGANSKSQHCPVQCT
ncbi:unnamed protein product [Hydatigera taeniaeformis]|uniref:RING-type domain-containing protein n=1 Tax=Hydatigena taeniaeformis TaxID=6205 RepID=A0A0R3WJP5_HYDTA|nr:unnamed protein product [Hydatigera taeniaeformis]